MRIFKKIKIKIDRAFRKYYEKRISLPYGIARFLSNVAFIQLSNQEYVELAPDGTVNSIWMTTLGMRPYLKYAVYNREVSYWQRVELIIEQRGFQVRSETEESLEKRKEVDAINSKKQLGAFLEPLPAAVFQEEDWKLAQINDPRIEPLTDIFLSFAFYGSLTAAHKKKIEAAA